MELRPFLVSAFFLVRLTQLHPPDARSVGHDRSIPHPQLKRGAQGVASWAAKLQEGRRISESEFREAIRLQNFCTEKCTKRRGKTVGGKWKSYRQGQATEAGCDVMGRFCMRGLGFILWGFGGG